MSAGFAALAVWSAYAQSVPCTVSHYVAPDERREFRFQRVGWHEDMVCVFTFQTEAGSPIGVAISRLEFRDVNEKNCSCGNVHIFDVNESGEQQAMSLRCAGESSEAVEGPVVAALASGNVMVVTLSTNGCLSPELWLTVGALNDQELRVASQISTPGFDTTIESTLPSTYGTTNEEEGTTYTTPSYRYTTESTFDVTTDSSTFEMSTTEEVVTSGSVRRRTRRPESSTVPTETTTRKKWWWPFG